MRRIENEQKLVSMPYVTKLWKSLLRHAVGTGGVHSLESSKTNPGDGWSLRAIKYNYTMPGSQRPLGAYH